MAPYKSLMPPVSDEEFAATLENVDKELAAGLANSEGVKGSGH